MVKHTHSVFPSPAGQRQRDIWKFSLNKANAILKNFQISWVVYSITHLLYYMTEKIRERAGNNMVSSQPIIRKQWSFLQAIIIFCFVSLFVLCFFVFFLVEDNVYLFSHLSF